MLRTILRPFRRLTYVGLFMNPFASRRVRDAQRRRARGWGSNGGAFGLGLLSFSGRGVESLEQRQLLAFTTDLNPITATAIDENSGAGQVVYTATSTDAGDISGGVTYSLKNGGDAGAFTIDSTTAKVKLTANPNYESKSSYSFTVVAEDAAGNKRKQLVTLAINNLDEVAPKITSGGVATASF